MKQIPSHLLLLLCFTFTLGIPHIGHAHKINVFAYVENETIYCEAVFSGGRPAQKASVKITDTVSGTILITGFTDTKGLYHIPADKIKSSAPLEVSVQTDDGHRNSWTISPEEYIHNTPQPDVQGLQKPKSSVPIKNIVIGLGCIFGLAGLIYYTSNKRTNHESNNT